MGSHHKRRTVSVSSAMAVARSRNPRSLHHGASGMVGMQGGGTEASTAGGTPPARPRRSVFQCLATCCCLAFLLAVLIALVTLTLMLYTSPCLSCTEYGPPAPARFRKDFLLGQLKALKDVAEEAKTLETTIKNEMANNLGH